MSKKLRLLAVALTWKRRIRLGVGLLILALALQLLVTEQPTATHRVLAQTRPQLRVAAQTGVESEAQLAVRKELERQIAQFTGEQTARFGIYIEHLPTGAIASYNPDTVFKTASLYKVFVARETMKRVEDDSWSLTDLVDTKRHLNIGRCLDKMITVSDNECGQKLQILTGAASDRLDWYGQGFTKSDLSGAYPTSTPRDVAKVFKDVVQKRHLSPSSNQVLLDLLTKQTINTRLPQQLPDGAIVAHKTGDLPGVVHDAGIVFPMGGGPYVIVVMSDQVNEPLPHINQAIAEFSKDIYNTLK